MEKIMEFLTGIATAPVWLWLALIIILAIKMTFIIDQYFKIKKLKNQISRMAAEHKVIIYDMSKDYDMDVKFFEKDSQILVDENEKLTNKVECLKGQLKKKTDELREQALHHACKYGEHPDNVMQAAKKYYRFLIGKE